MILRRCINTQTTQLEHILKSALEMTENVQDSGEQLLLETDPSCREPRSSYILRYQGIADKHIVSALQSADDVAKELGGTAWHEILSQNKGLALLLADCQLARDTLQASMRKTQEMQALNQVDCDQ